MGRPQPAKRGNAGRIVVVVIGVIALLVAGAVGGVGYLVYSGGFDAASDDNATDTHADPLGIDDPRSVPTGLADGLDGGQPGQLARQALQEAGFKCSYAGGERSATVYCHRADGGQPPTVDSAVITIVGSEVSTIDVEVELDPAWVNLSEPGDDNPFSRVDYDISAEVMATLNAVAPAVGGDADMPNVLNAISQAAQESDQQTLSTSFGELTIFVTNGNGALALRRSVDGHQVPTGMRYVTAAELEGAATEAGLTCERATESSTCTAGEVQLTIAFPRQTTPAGPGPAPDHDVESVRIVGPGGSGADPAMVSAAATLAELTAGKLGNGPAAAEWAGQCFGTHTQQVTVGTIELTCAPELDGDTAAPVVEQYTFTLS